MYMYLNIENVNRNDDKAVEEANIKPGEVLHLVLSLRGGDGMD